MHDAETRARAAEFGIERGSEATLGIDLPADPAEALAVLQRLTDVGVAWFPALFPHEDEDDPVEAAFYAGLGITAHDDPNGHLRDIAENAYQDHAEALTLESLAEQ